ncbi:precorrin-2 C(20)-methyltransferase [Bailinhaonella thermotolerans]|uniref:Precorrin-2 C(20)-methyltransferase n=1 Tax=Bailinhaonella thermotolerans TaxID=1070861 RepID=A0A3A4ATA3_9ACTN|nr:precorrin-2 C(20)-methyltransferase [Bailinhaonella thermotolerans]RJL22792.1 precorrin-2 C(20)-methyltransferase [Bailinhaonella thermotolerans]
MRLVGVGMGPGDPELVTVRAVRVLETADVVLVPVMALDEPGRAEATVRAHVTHDRVRRVVFALNDRGGLTARRTASWDAAGREVAACFAGGAATVAFATIGDPNLYSTFSYLAQTVTGLVPGVEIATVPGITAMQDLAARSGTVLAEGSEPLTLMPVTGGVERFAEALASDHTVVAYKFGSVAAEVTAALKASGRIDEAVYGSRLGLPDEDVRPARELGGEPAPYLSTLIVPGRRGSRGARL